MIFHAHEQVDDSACSSQLAKSVRVIDIIFSQLLLNKANFIYSLYALLTVAIKLSFPRVEGISQHVFGALGVIGNLSAILVSN